MTWPFPCQTSGREIQLHRAHQPRMAPEVVRTVIGPSQTAQPPATTNSRKSGVSVVVVSAGARIQGS